MTSPDPAAAPAPAPEPAAPPPRRLTRSSDDRLVGGVSGGLGRYFDADPILFRIGFVIAVLAGGAGLLAYGALWLLVPVDADAAGEAPLDGYARRRAVRAAVVVGAAALALAAGLAAALGTAFGAGELFAGLVILCGLGLVAGAFGGGRRWLLVPALVLAAPAALVEAAGLRIEGGVGERQHRPASVAELPDVYELGAGDLRVDLRDVKLPQGRTVVRIDLDMGEARVLVSDGACVASRARIGAGEATVLGHENGGVDIDWAQVPDNEAGAPELVIDARVGFGALEIRRAGEPAFLTEDWDVHDDGDDGPVAQEACRR